MVRQDLVDYIKKNVAKGYSIDYVQNFLIKHGFNAQEVGEALKASENKPRQDNNSLANAFAASEDKPYLAQPSQDQSRMQLKKREPLIVLLLGFVTFGIYPLYWLASTSNELRKAGKSAPNPHLLWLLLIPVVNLIVMILFILRYCKAIKELTNHSSVLLFIIFLLIFPLGMSLSQIEINKAVP